MLINGPSDALGSKHLNNSNGVQKKTWVEGVLFFVIINTPIAGIHLNPLGPFRAYKLFLMSL
jgi:hypothetical protein